MYGRPDLLSSAYADSSWNKILSARNCFDRFEHENFSVAKSWPISQDTVKLFVEWCIFKQHMTAGTVKSYVHCIGILHKLRNLDNSSCNSFITKLILRGAENLEFYKPKSSLDRRVMTIPLLRILGHEIAISDWSSHSKMVVWAAFCLGLFGSFTFGELLAKHERKYNPHETLLWRDIIFLNDNSIKILNKIPKTRKKDGEVISLFEFNYFNCCPIKALSKLKELSKSDENSPVFSFSNGSFLTSNKLNSLIQSMLSEKIGSEAEHYFCHSFRGALPSALAAIPNMDNDPAIMKWGRWDSVAFEKYVRLNHNAKRKLFAKFVMALTVNS